MLSLIIKPNEGGTERDGGGGAARAVNSTFYPSRLLVFP